MRRTLLSANLGIGRDPAMKRLQRTLETLGVTTVLDVGANVGQFGTLLRSAGYAGRIESFEPLPDAYATLSKRTSQDRDWTAHNCAIGDTTGTVTMNVSHNSYSSSILPMTSTHLDAAPDSRVVGTVDVPIRRLDDLTESLASAPANTLLKIDTQGYESQAIRGAARLMSEVGAVQLELSMVKLYEGQLLFDDLRRAMSEQGLELFAIEPGIADQQGRMLQCDGLFVRESLLPAAG